ncbi:MAG: RHS repeat-associated core domain-containing protein, partial [Nitrososphaerota archaeon]
SLTNPGSSTPLFATGLENADPPLTWTNTPSASTSITSVGGFCCALSGPELGTRSGEVAHNTTLPARTFGYTRHDEHYEDSTRQASPPSNCGPNWNTSCFLWEQTFASSNRYLSSASNGLGLAQTFTWAEGRNNTHGVGSGNDPTDTLFCDTHQSGYPCNEADDQNWSHVVLTSQTGTVQRPSSSGNPVPISSTTSYRYTLSHLSASPCSDCVVGYDWGNQNDNDSLDFYNAKFQGYTQATVSNPDGSVDVHKFYATDGWGVYDTAQVTCATSSPCHNAPWWSPGTALHGHEYEVDSYDTDGATLLTQRKTQYQVTCPPSGVGATPSVSGLGNWNGHLVSELDHNNPVAVCDIQTKQVDAFTWDGASSSTAVPHKTETYTYDNFGRQTSATTTSNDSGAMGSPTTIVDHTDYVWNDAVTPSATSVTGTYLIDFPAEQDVRDSGNTQHVRCQFLSYDKQSYTSGQTSALTRGEETTRDTYTNCGTAAANFTDPSGLIRATSVYNPYGNQVGTIDPDANAGVSGHTGCAATVSINKTDGIFVHASSCTDFDGTFASLPVATANALDQATKMGFSATTGGGFGLWPTSTTDTNGQTSSTSYDALGRTSSTKLPGETGGLTTTSTSYTAWCSGTGAQTPCIEVDSTQRLDSQTTVTSRAFYDGWGNLVETRAAAPGGQDVVQYADYDPSGRRIFLSIPYFVAAYTGGPGASAFAIPDAAQPGASTTYTNLLSTTVKDALSNSATTSVSVSCGQAADNTACYVATATQKPLTNLEATFTDALGRTAFSQTYGGIAVTGTNGGLLGGGGSTGGGIQPDAITKFSYDLAGNTTQILHPDGASKTTYSYDDAGRKVGMTDPDRGTERYSYDQNGNLVESVDARGASGTVFMGYDGLNRPLWHNTTNSASGAYVTYTYDDTTNGNLGVGRLTSEAFSGGPDNKLSGIYSYVYDARGQQSQTTLRIGGTDYPLKSTYDDAGHVLNQTYPDGEVVTTGYTPQGWLQSLSTQQNSITTTLLTSATYSGVGGAAGQLTGATLGNGTYTFAAGFDLLARATDLKYTARTSGTTLFESQPGYDAAGNVSGVATTLPQGTDQQQFCYDGHDRLTWAGSTGTAPCTGATVAGSTLTAAHYQQSFAYDNLNRLTSGPLGAYTYGDGAHLHAATSIGSTYTANYDASGNLICRAPTNSTTCASSSSPTGAQLSYDAEGRLTGWQDAPTAPKNTDCFLYDGAGHRVEQQVTQNGVTSSILYIGTAEEVVLTPSGTTTMTYYYAGGKRIALAVNGVFSYLGSDVLGSATVALDASGNTQASQLFAPYGAGRYSSGVMPTSYGFTGQRADAVTGLDYYGARYYDPAAGQFTSADTDNQAGLNRYAYVKGNPETLTDPTGHRVNCGSPDGCGAGGGGEGNGGGSGGGETNNGGGGKTPDAPPPVPPNGQHGGHNNGLGIPQTPKSSNSPCDKFCQAKKPVTAESQNISDLITTLNNIEGIAGGLSAILKGMWDLIKDYTAKGLVGVATYWANLVPLVIVLWGQMTVLKDHYLPAIKGVLDKDNGGDLSQTSVQSNLNTVQFYGQGMKLGELAVALAPFLALADDPVDAMAAGNPIDDVLATSLAGNFIAAVGTLWLAAGVAGDAENALIQQQRILGYTVELEF